MGIFFNERVFKMIEEDAKAIRWYPAKISGLSCIATDFKIKETTIPEGFNKYEIYIADRKSRLAYNAPVMPTFTILSAHKLMPEGETDIELPTLLLGASFDEETDRYSINVNVSMTFDAYTKFYMNN